MAKRPVRQARPKRMPQMTPEVPGRQGPGRGPGDAKIGAELAWLDPRIIIWPEVRITSQYRDGERDALSKSIQGQGQQQPVGVYLVDGQYVGADGKNRCLDAIEHGEASILCIVREGSGRDVLQSNIATALLRGHTNPLSVADVFWKAYNQEGIEVEELASASGRSMEWVQRMLQVSQVSPAVKQALGEEIIAMGHAEILSRIEAQEEQERALSLVLQHRWTVAELEEHLFGAPHGGDENASDVGQGPAVRNPRACTVCHTEQKHGNIQTLHVCDACVIKIGEIGSAHATPALVNAFTEALPALRDAETLLAQREETLHQAERLGRLAELLEQGDKDDSMLSIM